jgi:hypothetical protein
VALVREGTIATERPRLVGEVSASFWGYKVLHGHRGRSLRPYSLLYRPEPLLFLSRSSSIVLMRRSRPHSGPTTSQKIWKRRESNPDLWICSQEPRPLDQRRRSSFKHIRHYFKVSHRRKFSTNEKCLHTIQR